MVLELSGAERREGSEGGEILVAQMVEYWIWAW